MSVMMETEKDEIKNCVFYGFLNVCSVNRHKPFIALLDQRLRKIKGSSAKRQDGLRINLELVQSKLYLHNDCHLHYTSSYHIAKYLKRNPPTQKCSSVEELVAKRRGSTLLPFNFKENCFFCGEICSLRPDPCNPSRWKKLILCRIEDRGKGEKSFNDVILHVWDYVSMTIKI